MLLAVPNVSEGRDASRIATAAEAFSTGVFLLDTHSDAAHNRSVFTLASRERALRAALIAGAEATIAEIDISAHAGEHPRIGALDVCPVVWLDPEDRARAHDEALAVAGGIASLGVPVFLYGELASTPERTERAYFRAGGPSALAERIATGELAPDLGPGRAHPTAGATLVTARPPMAAFNLALIGIGLAGARAIAAKTRESGPEGIPGVRAIGIDRGPDGIQVSTNVHDPTNVPLAVVTERVRSLARAVGGEVVAAEIVGLVPRAALEGFPVDMPIPGFDPARGVIEERIAALPE